MLGEMLLSSNNPRLLETAKSKNTDSFTLNHSSTLIVTKKLFSTLPKQYNFILLEAGQLNEKEPDTKLDQTWTLIKYILELLKKPQFRNLREGFAAVQIEGSQDQQKGNLDRHGVLNIAQVQVEQLKLQQCAKLMQNHTAPQKWCDTMLKGATRTRTPTSNVDTMLKAATRTRTPTSNVAPTCALALYCAGKSSP
ncbi:hypothetical protein BDR26DRAFT_902805 [Obelidium mucronatum]|nr:hypothetical protein BDR26DRAFT_902805 [Obelidium mucronatum]